MQFKNKSLFLLTLLLFSQAKLESKNRSVINKIFSKKVITTLSFAGFAYAAYKLWTMDVSSDCSNGQASIASSNNNPQETPRSNPFTNYIPELSFVSEPRLKGDTEQRYLALTDNNLNYMQHALSQAGLSQQANLKIQKLLRPKGKDVDWQPKPFNYSIVSDYLTKYECISSFEYESLPLGNKLHALPNNKFATIFGPYIKIRDLNGTCINTLVGHSKSVNFLYVLPNGRLVSASFDGTIRIWDVESGECIKIIACDSFATVICSLGNNRLVSGHRKQIKIWDINSGECLATHSTDVDHIEYLRFLGNDKLISDCSTKIQIWDINSGNCLHQIFRSNNLITDLCVLPNNKLAFRSGKKITIYDLESIDFEKSLEHGSYVSSLCLLSNNLLVSASLMGVIKIWNLQSGECVDTIESSDCIIDLRALDNGRFASLSQNINPKNAPTKNIAKVWGTLDLTL